MVRGSGLARMAVGDSAGVSPHILAAELGQEVEKVPGGSSPTLAAAAMGLCTSGQRSGLGAGWG